MQLGREMSVIRESEYATDSWVIMKITKKAVKFVMPLRSSFSLSLHYSFQERIVESKNEINIP